MIKITTIKNTHREREKAATGVLVMVWRVYHRTYCYINRFGRVRGRTFLLLTRYNPRETAHVRIDYIQPPP